MFANAAAFRGLTAQNTFYCGDWAARPIRYCARPAGLVDSRCKPARRPSTRSFTSFRADLSISILKTKISDILNSLRAKRCIFCCGTLVPILLALVVVSARNVDFSPVFHHVWELWRSWYGHGFGPGLGPNVDSFIKRPIVMTDEDFRRYDISEENSKPFHLNPPKKPEPATGV